MGVREDSAARVRVALLAAAASEFAERGFEGASVRRIAGRAGIAAGTVFNYAASKHDLLHQVLRDALDGAVIDALAVPDELPAVDALVAMAGVLFDLYARDPGLSRTLLQHALFAEGDAGAAFRDQVETVAMDAGRRVAAAQAAGQLRPVPPRTAALAFVSAYYFALLAGLAAGAPDVAYQREQVRSQLAALLETDP